MQAAVRTYLTAGVATVGAGVIALAPIAPPMPTVHLPSVQQAEVALSAAVNPIEAWVQVVQQAVANLGDLGSQLSADPAPILQQVIVNQTADIHLLGSAVQASITGLTNSLQALPATLQAAAKQLAAGQVVDATNTLLAPVLGDLAAILIDPFTLGFPAVTNPMQNLTNFVETIPTLVASIGVPLLNPVFSVINAAAATVQTVIDSNPAAALSAIINAPATLTGALLNGFGNNTIGLPAGGLLSPDFGGLGAFTAGPIGALIAIRDAFAQAITPQKTQAALKTAASPAALPAGGTTVTLSTGTASTAAPVVKTKAKASDSAATDSATTGADSTGTTATTTPVKAKHSAADSSSAGSTGKTTSGGAHSANTHHAKAGKGGSGK